MLTVRTHFLSPEIVPGGIAVINRYGDLRDYDAVLVELPNGTHDWRWLHRDRDIGEAWFPTGRHTWERGLKVIGVMVLYIDRDPRHLLL